MPLSQEAAGLLWIVQLGVSVALGAVLGLRLGEALWNIMDKGVFEADKRFKVTVLWGPAMSVAKIGGGSVVEAFGNVRGYLHDEGPALEQVQA
mgnify:CR=1 FL=1